MDVDAISVGLASGLGTAFLLMLVDTSRVIPKSATCGRNSQTFFTHQTTTPLLDQFGNRITVEQRAYVTHDDKALPEQAHHIL